MIFERTGISYNLPSYAGTDGYMADPHFFGRILSRIISDPIHKPPLDSAGVLAVFLARYPSAVVWPIIAIVVNAVNLITFGPLAHVVNKVTELSPPFTNSNTATTVPRIFSGLFIAASLEHTRPTPVGWMIMRSMSCVQFLLAFFIKTSTGFRVPIPKRPPGQNIFYATNASADPCNITAFNTGFADNRQSPVCAPNHVNFTTHEIPIYNDIEGIIA